MDGDRGVCLVKVQSVSQKLKDELGWLVKSHLLDFMPHTMEARTLVTEDWVAALLAGLPKSLFKFRGLFVCDFGHTFAFPDGAAAKGGHVLREYHFVAGFVQKADHLLDKGLVNSVVVLWEAHHLVDAAREIDYFVYLGRL